jgi:hypothetical protein
VLIETLKVDTSLPKSLDSEKESIDKRITDILEKLNPDLIYDILNQVKAGKLSSEVLQTLLPAFLELIKKYSEELKKKGKSTMIFERELLKKQGIYFKFACLYSTFFPKEFLQKTRS